MCHKQVQVETESLLQHNKEGNAAKPQELVVPMPAGPLTTCLNVAGFVHAAVLCLKEHFFGNTGQPRERQEPLSGASQGFPTTWEEGLAYSGWCAIVLTSNSIRVSSNSIKQACIRGRQFARFGARHTLNVIRAFISKDPVFVGCDVKLVKGSDLSASGNLNNTVCDHRACANAGQGKEVTKVDPSQHTEGPAQAARQQAQETAQAEPTPQVKGPSEAEPTHHAKGGSQAEPTHQAKGPSQSEPTHHARGPSQAEPCHQAKGSSQAERTHHAEGLLQAEPAHQQAQQQIKAATDPQKGHQPIAEAAAHQGMHAEVQHPQAPQQASKRVQDSGVRTTSQPQPLSESMSNAALSSKQGTKAGSATIDIQVLAGTSSQAPMQPIRHAAADTKARGDAGAGPSGKFVPDRSEAAAASSSASSSMQPTLSSKASENPLTVSKINTAKASSETVAVGNAVAPVAASDANTAQASSKPVAASSAITAKAASKAVAASDANTAQACRKPTDASDATTVKASSKAVAVPFCDSLGEDGWEACPFNTETKGYRAEGVRGREGPLSKPVPVAVKVMHPSDDPDGALELRLSANHEAHALAALNVKPLQNFITALRLVHLPDPAQPSAPAYLVMGLAKGKDLEYIRGAICDAASEMQEGPELNALKAWTWKFGLQVVELMAKALYRLHKAGHMHRDLKPMNIMVSGFKGGKPLKMKLIDWANARHKNQHLSNLEVSMAFASPQLLPYAADLQNCPVMDDMPNDMWAFGVSLHRWLICACGNYQWAFGPHLDPNEILSPEQQQADVDSKQESWAKAHSMYAKFGYSSTSSMDPVISSIFEAADFSAEGHDKIAQASNVSKLLCGLLNPDASRRIKAADLNSSEFAWLRPESQIPLPKCPVTVEGAE